MNLKDMAVVQTVINVILFVIMFTQQQRINRQQAALKWFAQHIKIDPNWRSEPMPEDLAALVESISEDQEDE